MRTRLLSLSLVACLACANDDHRGQFDLSSSSATAQGDGGDPRTVPPRAEGTDPGNAIGTEVTGGGTAPRLDASVIDAAPADTSVSSDADVPFGYQCVTSNDCTLRNIGSCCGFVTRCANANAIFTMPDCSGMPNTGNCSSPPIDGCACQQGQCVSLQLGTPVDMTQ